MGPLIQARVRRKKRTGPFVCYKKGTPGYREGGETWGPQDGNICSVLMWGAAQPGFGTQWWPAFELRELPASLPPSLAAGVGEGGEGGLSPHSSLLTIQEVSGSLTPPFPKMFVVPLPLGLPRKIGFKYPTKKSVVSYNLEVKKVSFTVLQKG